MRTQIRRFKRLLFGRPLPSDRLDHERLNKKTALAVLSSDAISSVAYATEQTLLVLAVLGTAALSYVVPISAVIVGLLVLVALSYRQTVFAYPNGGGSYTVAKDNLGTMPGLIAAAALLTDYILTVSVSISSGVAAITSAYPPLFPHAVVIGIAAIFILMLVNLRGVRESGIAFSVPTYIFIVLMLALIATGLYRGMMGSNVIAAPAPVRVDPFSARHGEMAPMGLALVFLILRGFAEGCVAMTGTEAISNGVGAFKTPSSRNAAITLGWMAAILAAFFMGTSYLARHYQVMPTAERDSAVTARPPHLRQRLALLRAAVRDVRDPGARREYRLRRLSATGEHSGTRWLHAATVRGARRPACVLQRHHRARAWLRWFSCASSTAIRAR